MHAQSSKILRLPLHRTPPLLALLLCLWLASASLAQVPTTLHYQGRLLQNTADQDAATGTVDIRFSIWTEASGGTELWSEPWTGVALSNGIFGVLLGSNGTPLDPADFQSDSSLFLELEIDGETLSPRQQLGSAPFAMVDEPANELQDLGLSGDILSLSGSSATVDLSAYLDDTDTDQQDLSLAGNTLGLTNDPSTVDLSGYLDNTDAQTLSLDGNTLSISGSASSVELGDAASVATVEAFITETFYEERTVFVTSQTFDGQLGGTLEDADHQCQSLAEQAGLDGVFQAWISDTTGSPDSRFGRGGSFALVDGTPVAKNWLDLTDGTLLHAIDLTELGTTIGAGATAWTNTRTDGTALGTDDCDGWGSYVGVGAVGWPDRSDASWTEPAGSPTGLCDDFLHHLYCFEAETYSAPNSQTLSLVGDSLQLTSDDGTDSVDLSTYLDDTTIDNQVLSLSGNQLRLTSDDGTDSVDLSTYLDDTTIDNQVLSLSGNQLRLTSDDGTDSVDLSAYVDNDQQTLSLSDDTLSISGSGASVDLATASIINELLERIKGLESSTPQTIFVTSQTYTGNLGGLAGADAICQGLAEAAGLFGNFSAWLSDSTGSPSSRFSQEDRPIVRVDGTLVANDWSDLTDGTLPSPISVSETGAAVGSETVWTNTNFGGGAFSSTDHCADWTSDSTSSSARVGTSGAVTGQWSSSNIAPCDRALRLYCLG